MALSHLSLSNPCTQLTEWESAQSDMKGNEEMGGPVSEFVNHKRRNRHSLGHLTVKDVFVLRDEYLDNLLLVRFLLKLIYDN